jgi:exosortase
MPRGRADILLRVTRSPQKRAKWHFSEMRARQSANSYHFVEVEGVTRWAAAIALGVVVAILYWPILTKLVSDWWNDPDYSHALIVVPLALGFVWARRRELARTPPASSSAGLLIAVASLTLLVVGTLGAELFLARISLLGFVAGSVVYLLGWRHLRMLAFPLTLTALTIPIPAIVITRLTLSLQLCASTIAESLLMMLRIPVLREGNVLVLPNATLQVAEACSGIRSMTALLTLALIVARFSDLSWPRRMLIVLSAIPIAVLVNGFRVAAASVGARWFGAAAVEGSVHEILGWLMFLVAFLLMAGCVRIVGGRVSRPAATTLMPSVSS